MEEVKKNKRVSKKVSLEVPQTVLSEVPQKKIRRSKKSVPAVTIDYSKYTFPDSDDNICEDPISELSKELSKRFEELQENSEVEVGIPIEEEVVNEEVVIPIEEVKAPEFDIELLIKGVIYKFVNTRCNHSVQCDVDAFKSIYMNKWNKGDINVESVASQPKLKSSRKFKK